MTSLFWEPKTALGKLRLCSAHFLTETITLAPTGEGSTTAALWGHYHYPRHRTRGPPIKIF